MENPHLAPILITGGASIATIIALSRASDSKPSATSTTHQNLQKLTNENITSEFIAAIPEITPEINLELATATQTEVLTKSSPRVLWACWIGTSTAQIRVPVTYRYHLCLREPWKLEIQDKRVIVHAPALRPSLPPAIHTATLETLTVRGWCRGSTAHLLEQTQREITPTLIQYASDPKHLGLVRQQCRQSVAELVRLWLERERRWGRHGITEIQIMFLAEEDPPIPTLRPSQ